jgi:hypothetical protein
VDITAVRILNLATWSWVVSSRITLGEPWYLLLWLKCDKRIHTM